MTSSQKDLLLMTTQLRESVGRSRRRPYWLARFAVPAAVAVMAVLGSAGVASASPHAQAAPRTPHVKIRLTRSRSFCAAIKNNNNHAGAIVWLYKCTKSKSDTWVEVDGLDCNESGKPICTEFLDPKNMSLCMALNGARKVVLQGCGQNGNNAPSQSQWITDTGAEDGWRDFAWGPNGDLAVLKVKDKQRLIGVDASGGCGGCWFHWTDH